MINHNENEGENEKIDQIDTTLLLKRGTRSNEK